MEKCSVTNCENPGTQLFNVPAPPVTDGKPFICSYNTLFHGEGELTFCIPGEAAIPLCPEHYDSTVAYYRQMSESDNPANEEYRELVRLNS
jgi:hypothetical protein